MNSFVEVLETISPTDHAGPTSCHLQEVFTVYSRKELDDASLVESIKEGQPGAESDFVVKYRASLYALLLQFTGDAGRAEDLAHETLLLILQKLREQGIRKPHKLTSYVFSTAKFVYFGWLRRKDNQLELMDSVTEIASVENNPEDECIAIEESANLEALIDRLNVPRDREILSRHYVRDQSKREICEAMSLSLQHFDRVISRARYRLRDCASTT